MSPALAQLSIWAPTLVMMLGYLSAVARRDGAMPDAGEKEREQAWASRSSRAFGYGLIATASMVVLSIIDALI